MVKFQTWTCHLSGSSSFVTLNDGSSLGTRDEGQSIHGMRSILNNESSCQGDIFLTRWPTRDHFVAFFHLCSKFLSTSCAAGPSILQCKSCHGCLGPFIPDYRRKIWSYNRKTDSWINKSNLSFFGTDNIINMYCPKINVHQKKGTRL